MLWRSERTTQAEVASASRQAPGTLMPGPLFYAHPGWKWARQCRDSNKADAAQDRNPLRTHIGPAVAAAHLHAAHHHEQAHNQDDRRSHPDRRRSAMPQSERYRDERDAKNEIDKLSANYRPKLEMKCARRRHGASFRVARKKTVASSF